MPGACVRGRACSPEALRLCDRRTDFWHYWRHFPGLHHRGVAQQHLQPERDPRLAWRLPLHPGGVFGLVSVYLRKFLHETPIFQELQARKAADRELPIKTILRDHREACVVAALDDLGAVHGDRGGDSVHTSLSAKGVPHRPAMALKYNAVATVTLTIGCVFWGWLSDKIGTKLTMLIGWAARRPRPICST